MAPDAVVGDRDVVDLGYQLHQGRTVNDTLITFRNIRYAAPPLGALRFRAPIPPLVDRSIVQEPSDVIPPQAWPSWVIKGSTAPVTPPDIPPTDPRTSEDCLFLDVLLPRSVWEKRRTVAAPVFVWIPGGGFCVGWKDAGGAGSGMVIRSTDDDHDGMIYVSINYRLGLFGWMHGDDVTSNAGLLDQRLALEWVQSHIGAFGGDKDNVTVLGLSAGGGSAVAHITAYGGEKGPAPFIGAIIQSPYHPPDHTSLQSSVVAVLKYGNISSLAELRARPTEELQKLNALLVGNATPFGSWLFGISIDNDYVPNLPNRLLLEHRFDKNIRVMTSHTQDEGSSFVPNSLISNEQLYEDHLMATFPSLASSPHHLRVLTKELYPPVFDGSQGYTDQVGRNSCTIADALVVHNARALNQAPFCTPGYAYKFTAPPAKHGADISWTFYDSGEVPEANSTASIKLQKYICNFVRDGDPNGPGLPEFPPTNAGAVVQNIGIDGFGPIPDDGRTKQLDARHRFWQTAPYFQ